MSRQHHITKLSMLDIYNITRFPTRVINMGDRPMGGNHPIRLQSMTSTNTLDVKATVAQTIRIIEAGADYVRISTPSIESAHKLKEIKSELKAAGFNNPLIADIHFNPEVALIAAPYTGEVRINPGNYTAGLSRSKTDFSAQETQEHLELIANRLRPLVAVCKDHGTAIRIGTNMGSLSPRIVAKFGNTSQAMVESTLEFIKVFRGIDFHDLIISVKASKPLVMIQAYEGMVTKMLENGLAYPLHIGITEAGEGENGKIKSALGICALLNKGIGDTIRVSLTDDPEFEIPVARALAAPYQRAFTAKTTNQPYNLVELKSNDNTLSVFGDTNKVIVIEKYTDSQTNLLNHDKGLVNDTKAEPATSTAEREADLLYFPDGKPDTKYEGEKILLKAQKGQNEHQMDVFPIINLEKIDKLGTVASQDHFLDISNCGIPDGDFCIGNKTLAIIADIDMPLISRDINKIVAFCREWGRPLIIKKRFEESNIDDLTCSFAGIIGPMLMESKVQGLWIDAPALKGVITNIVFGFLQSSGLRITRTEFISCPTCARTSFDLQRVLREIQKKTDGIPGLKIAVMGCVVNGPGEMADADFGYVGAGNGKIHLYKGKTPVRKNVAPKDAVTTLLDLLAEYGYIKE